MSVNPLHKAFGQPKTQNDCLLRFHVSIVAQCGMTLQGVVTCRLPSCHRHNATTCYS